MLILITRTREPPFWWFERDDLGKAQRVPGTGTRPIFRLFAGSSYRKAVRVFDALAAVFLFICIRKAMVCIIIRLLFYSFGYLGGPLFFQFPFSSAYLDTAGFALWCIYCIAAFMAAVPAHIFVPAFLSHRTQCSYRHQFIAFTTLAGFSSQPCIIIKAVKIHFCHNITYKKSAFLCLAFGRLTGFLETFHHW